MAELFTLIHALNFQESQATSPIPSKNLNVIGVLGALTPEFIPGQFTFAVIIGVRSADFSESHRLRLQFSGPSDEVIVDSGEIWIPSPEMPPTSPVPFLMLGTQLTNVIFTQEGRYKTSVFWDGHLLGRTEIPVFAKIPNRSMSD